MSRSGNMIARKFYFDFQELEVYRGIAAALNMDFETLATACIRQGMVQAEQQLMQVIQEEAEAKKKPLEHTPKTDEQVQATKESTDYERSVAT